ncbi:MAG: hypothetical protein UHN02_00035 [Acutalibacteraceae bacterium]|nr:hypothetical protein [Acutalibacteraceae bacterium]
MSDKKEMLTYKGKPLVRKGKEIYYGDMSDDFVILFTIMSTDKSGKLELAEKVRVQLLSTDTDLPMEERVVKKSEKVGFYNAMDIGSIWLERALDEKK